MTLATLPWLRLLRSKPAWVWVVATMGLSLVSAWRERLHGAPHGADYALLDVYASVGLPLLVLAIVGATTDGGGLARSASLVYRWGAEPRRALGVTLLVSAVASAVLSGALGAAVALAAHGSGDPPAGGDALHTLCFGALAGAAYAAYFGLGAAIGLGGWGRWVFLAVDWALGGGTDVGASLTPRAHLRNLLGGEAPVDLLPRESLVALVILGGLWMAAATNLAARRLGRAPS